MDSTAHISAARLNANRQNAAHSTGPRTSDGKKRTRLNGLRHGLTGNTVVMPYENREDYEAFVAQTIAGFHPESENERALASSIADDHWRLQRAHTIEQSIFAPGQSTGQETCEPVGAAFSQAQTFLNNTREIMLVSLYEIRIKRKIRNNLAELNRLQDERKASRENAIEKLLVLAQLNESKGIRADEPVADGFGFSSAEIAGLLNRNRRLNEARALFPSLK